jgi:mRNA-degrading endonuclease RelE of RelBE toxin-antitoxin system
MQFRLLIDIDVLEFLQRLPPPTRRQLLAHFRKIQDFPGQYCDHIHTDDVGRRLDVSLCRGLAIIYWTDSADQHVKILQIIEAD